MSDLNLTFFDKIYNSDYVAGLEERVHQLVAVTCAFTALQPFHKEYEIEEYILKIQDYPCIRIDTLYFSFVVEYEETCKVLGCDVEVFKKRFNEALKKMNQEGVGFILGHADERYFPPYDLRYPKGKGTQSIDLGV